MMRLGKFEYSVDQLKNQPEHSLGPSKEVARKKIQESTRRWLTAAGIRRSRQLDRIGLPHIIGAGNANSVDNGWVHKLV